MDYESHQKGPFIIFFYILTCLLFFLETFFVWIANFRHTFDRFKFAQDSRKRKNEMKWNETKWFHSSAEFSLVKVLFVILFFIVVITFLFPFLMTLSRGAFAVVCDDTFFGYLYFITFIIVIRITYSWFIVLTYPFLLEVVKVI